MAVEVSLNTIGSGYNRALINENFVEIESALEDALSRTGVSPNEMGTDLDLNSNDLLNVGVTNTERLIVAGTELATDELTAVGPPGESATITVGTVTTGAAGTSVIVTNVGNEVDAVFDITIPRGDTGASGAGTGDMVAAQNLNDVVSKPTAFANIKQAATESVTGVVELATTAEAATGTDTIRAVTAAGVKAAIDSQVPPLVTGDVVKLLDSSVSSAATLSIDLSSYTGYQDFVLILENFKPVSDGVDFRLRTSVDGSTYDTGASDYGVRKNYGSLISSSSTTDATASLPYIDIINGIGNSTGESVNNAKIYLNNNKTNGIEKVIESFAVGKSSTGTSIRQDLVGKRNNTSVVLGLRVYFSTGNISSGDYRLYGYK